MTQITLRQFSAVAGKIGLLSFGGPAAQIALMQDELVDRRRWIDQSDFLRALSFCMLLPGPEAMQLATYLGWRLHGTLGGIIGGLLFVLPGALVIFALGLAYVNFGDIPVVAAAFLGIKACVVVIVIQALIKISNRALVGALPIAIAATSFVAIGFLNIDYPIVVALAAFLGILCLNTNRSDNAKDQGSGKTLSLTMVFVGLWAAPFSILTIWRDAFLIKIATVFSVLAVVTFGGAYAVLGYLSQTAVTDLGWITSDQMVDALGLAETTPGPLILVTQFVGFLAGVAEGGIWRGIIAGCLTLWVTFIPCFLWIFLFAPHLNRLMTIAWISRALAGITAAVVGVIASISMWFGIQIWFENQVPYRAGPISILAPVWQSVDLQAIAISVVAALLLIWRRWDIIAVLPTAAVLGVLLS